MNTDYKRLAAKLRQMETLVHTIRYECEDKTPDAALIASLIDEDFEELAEQIAELSPTDDEADADSRAERTERYYHNLRCGDESRLRPRKWLQPHPRDNWSMSKSSSSESRQPAEPQRITINIEKLIEHLEISTPEDVEKVKGLLTEALAQAVVEPVSKPIKDRY